MFHKYTGNEQFDLQINRFTRDYENDPKVQEDLKKIVPQLKDIDSWFKCTYESSCSRFRFPRKDRKHFVFILYSVFRGDF